MRLEAKDVNISISGKPIVQHLSIEVPDRKFSALLYGMKVISVFISVMAKLLKQWVQNTVL